MYREGAAVRVLLLALVVFVGSTLSVNGFSEAEICEAGCSGERAATVCGADGRRYQSECLARCQDVTLVACAMYHTGAGMLEPRGLPITREHMDRFRDEGFKLLGHAKTRPFMPSAKREAHNLKHQAASAKEQEAREHVDPRLTQAIRHTADGLVYAATVDMTEQQQGWDAAAAAAGAGNAYVPKGLPVSASSASSRPAGKGSSLLRKLKYIFGNDDREEITGIAQFPYSAIGMLTTAGEESIVCTGAMVGNRSVLTAARCVYDRNTSAWQTGFQFAPNAYGGGSYPYGQLDWASVTTFAEWTNSSTKDPWKYDMAIIQLANTAAASVTNSTGWLGLAYVPGKFTGNVSIAMVKPDGTYWNTTCNVTDDSGTDGLLLHQCPTGNGESIGAPIFICVESGDCFVHAVDTEYLYTSARGQPRANVGCEITERNVKILYSWIQTVTNP